MLLATILTILISPNQESKQLKASWDNAHRSATIFSLACEITEYHEVQFVDQAKWRYWKPVPAVFVGRTYLGTIRHPCCCGLGLIKLHKLVTERLIGVKNSRPITYREFKRFGEIDYYEDEDFGYRDPDLPCGAWFRRGIRLGHFKEGYRGFYLNSPAIAEKPHVASD